MNLGPESNLLWENKVTDRQSSQTQYTGPCLHLLLLITNCNVIHPKVKVLDSVSYNLRSLRPLKTISFSTIDSFSPLKSCQRDTVACELEAKGKGTKASTARRAQKCRTGSVKAEMHLGENQYEPVA